MKNIHPEQKKNQMLAQLIHLVPGAIYQFQLFPDGRSCFPFASDGIREIFEFSPESVVEDASAIFSLVHPEDIDTLYASIQESAMTLQPWQMEYRVILPKKGERWLFGRSIPQAMPDASVLWHGNIIDITDRKRADQLFLRHQSIISTARDGFWIVDSEGYLREVNQAYALISGYTITELQGMHVSDLEALETKADIHQRMTRLILIGSDRFETQHRHKDGSLLDLEVSVNYLAETRECFAFFRDITERKLIEKQLNENLTLFHAVFNNAAVGIAHTSITGQFLQMNEEYCRIIGYSQEEILSQKLHFAQITHPDDLNPDLKAAQEIQKGTRNRYHNEKRYIRRDGSIVWVLVNIQAVRDEHGKLLYQITAVVDITDRKQTELQLFNSEDKFAKVFKNSPVGIGITRLKDGVFIDVNSAFLDIYGYQRGEVIEKSALDLKLWAYPEQCADAIEKFKHDGRLINQEINIRHKSGEPRTVLTCIEPITIANDECLLGLITDVSERVELALACEKLNSELELRVIERTHELEMNRRELEATSLHLRQLAAETEWVTERERKQIAVEVHDQLGQNLTALRMQIAMLKMMSFDKPKQFESHIETMLGMIDVLIQNVRNVSANLYPVVLDMGVEYALGNSQKITSINSV